MGIIAGALGGLAGAAGDIAQNTIDMRNKATLAQQMAEIDVEKARRIEEMKVASENAQRQAMVDRIGSARQGVVDDAVNRKFGGPMDAANGGPATDNQLAAAQAQRNQYAQQVDASPDTYTQAAIRSGDIDPKTAATLTNRYEMAQMKADWEKQRIGDLQAYHQGMLDIRQQLADAKSSNDQTGRLMAQTLLTNTHGDLESTRKEYNDVSNELVAAKKDKKEALMQRLDALRSRIDMLRGREDQLTTYMLGGLNARGMGSGGGSPAPAPAASAPAPAAKPAAAPAPVGARPEGSTVSSAEQVQRDREALPIIEAELAKAKTDEQRAPLQRELQRLRNRLGNAAPAAKPAAAASAPALPKGWSVRIVGQADDQDTGAA